MVEITEFQNAKYINETWIDCDVNHPQHGWIPFTVNPDDTGSDVDIPKLYDTLVKSNPEPYIPPTQEELDERKAGEIRGWRDNILQYEVDPYVMNMMRWGELSDEMQEKVKTYRERLLEVPQQDGFPHDVKWPTRDF